MTIDTFHSNNLTRTEAIRDHLKAEVFADWNPDVGYIDHDFTGAGHPAAITHLDQDGLVLFYHDALKLLMGVAWKVVDLDIAYVGVIEPDGQEVVNSQVFTVGETLEMLEEMDEDSDRWTFLLLLGDAAHLFMHRGDV